MTAIKYRTADVDGFNTFYREAGAAGAPRLLLLHGLPSAGHMFRDLIPLLCDRFHIVNASGIGKARATPTPDLDPPSPAMFPAIAVVTRLPAR